jgi:hypothetical protein
MIIKKFEIFNEGWKNWISGLMILFNLGVVGKDSNIEHHSDKSIKEWVLGLEQKESECLEILDQLELSGNQRFDFITMNNKFNDINNNYRNFNNYNFKDFLLYLNNNDKLPIKASLTLINIPIPGDNLFNIPLYNLHYDINNNIKLDVFSTFNKDIKVDLDLVNNLTLDIMVNPLFTKFGIKKKF